VLQVEIRIREQLDQDWSDWLAGFSVVHTEGGETLLAGPVRDQAALRGILNLLADLGLQLSSVSTSDR
jgi:hypothetical protein